MKYTKQLTLYPIQRLDDDAFHFQVGHAETLYFSHVRTGTWDYKFLLQKELGLIIETNVNFACKTTLKWVSMGFHGIMQISTDA